MLKTEVQTQFGQLVSEVIWPEFKARNYRKTGNNFRIYHSDGWGKILNIQKSAYRDRNEISFTINTGLYLVKADTMFEEPRAAKFLEPDCLVRNRIGRLNGSNHDLWYDLNELTPALLIQQQVLDDVKGFVLPYLDKIDSVDDIVQQILRERLPKSRQAIQAVFNYGYTQEALNWVEEEIATTIYRTWRQELEDLRKSFK
ncbi:DUF4304 domain-containing protein [Hymenobacter ruricola]|uniref:DUF4304 domain-containing protein n=1 Tax=Hymenobacter ruricola TaxID=2791023 RepID=A0ABS0I747_9BACT|nr:DUF4304 domain-containing protein [Hymenobacter ruricola]MBF9222791.1 DUF4304 domain-containing protein [Hymenobacter ruricola]